MNKPIFASITSLVVAGFAAAALPLLVAVTSAALQVRELGAQAERSVVQSVQMTRETEALGSELVSMERNARQYQVLGDESLKEIYLRRDENVRRALERLEQWQPILAPSAELVALEQELERLRLAMTAEHHEAALAVALPAFSRVQQSTNRIRQASQDTMEANLETLTGEARRMQTALIWQTALLGVVGFGLSVLFARAILQPIRQINQTITRFGEDRYGDEVVIGGPRDLRQVGERLEWLGRRLAELEGLKNEFMRHVSHELKTPLANIRESTALLKDETVGQLSGDQHEILRILDKSGARLTLLINNLLEFSEWKEQHSSLTLSRFSVAELVKDVLDEHRLSIESRGLKIDSRVSDGLVISADRDRIRTLMTNLVSNAVKYSPPGGRVTVKAGERNGRLQLDVIDEGPGIPESEQQLVFKPFFQSNDSKLVRPEGTGIGLSLVQECVHAHGGYAEFMDTEPGTHFHATLPVVIEEMTS